MKPILTSLLALGICLIPTTVTLTPQPSLAQTQPDEAQLQQLLQQALQYTQQGKPQQSIETFQQVLRLAQQKGDKKNEATAYLGLGFNYNSIGQPKLALENYNQALLIFREIKNRNGEAATLNNIGEVYRRIGKPEEALKYYNQALPIFKEVGNRSGEATTLNNIGAVYDSIGKPEEALKYYNQALPIFKEVGNRSGEAVTLNNIGEVYDSIGKPEEALKYYNQALPIRREVGDRSGEATTLNSIGGVYYSIGKPEEALKYYNQALPISREVSDRSGEATTLNNIGEVYRSIGKPEEALKYYNQALPISREVSDRSGEATTLNNIGGVYHDIGKPEEALKYYNQALPILREISNRSIEATTLNNIGLVYDDIGKPEEALKYYNQALPILREVGNRSVEAVTLNNIGAVYRGIGKPEEALKYYSQALPILREVGNRSGEATTLNNIGLVYDDIGKPEEALKYYNQALPILREVGNRSVEAVTLNNIGFVYRDTNQPDKAIANWEESLKITLDIRKGLGRNNRKAFIEANTNTAITLVDLLIKQKQTQKAYEWANLVTTYDLADYGRLINAKVANPEAQKELDLWKELNTQLTSLQSQQEDNKRQGKYATELAQRINAIQAQANQKAEDMSRRFPEVAELFETNPTDIKKLQENLPQNTVVIQPFLLTGIKNAPNTIAIFVLTKDKLTVIQKPLSDDFNQTLSQFRKQLEEINSGYTETGGKLYDIFIRPVEEQFPIPSGYQIAIIATGRLRNIPFEPLYDSQADKFLLEKYPISYLTRISTNQKSQVTSQKFTPLQALALANPRPTKQELEGTEKEADYLIQNFPGSQDYRHEKATLDTFKNYASRFSILHLGTHGCFVAEGCPNLDMQPNTILFANNQQYPIADAALLGLKDTEIIVIGACQTAQITEVEGVGLSGLAYIWERAGAKSLIASLWNAADPESAAMMQQFYGNLKQGMSKAEAMRQAKLKLIDQHPFFWSPFILIGDAQ